ncbi:PREDICTED: uncharacterized protein LOC108564083 [Nicrophorus vespilloides]|uniref:Uncharacterized protein LOC108564083 n=1 Tax=Nicrophorus vespilloides TaxID=110193 RepID=A0ABM1MV81_NICVS|nr:PREDICTED: uncharacterized protein LOC108564083 [Nicrophorus vespilloides]
MYSVGSSRVMFAMFRICFLLIPLVSAFNLFSQNTYKIEYHHGIVEGFNKQFVDFFKFAYNKYNRTARAFDLKIRFSKKIETMKVLLEAFKFINNQYRSFIPINMVFDVCSAIKSDLFGMKELMTKSGNFTSCPIQKDSYVMEKFTPDETQFPPNIPLGQYKFSLSFTTNDKFLMKFTVASEVKNRKDV